MKCTKELFPFAFFFRWRQKVVVIESPRLDRIAHYKNINFIKYLYMVFFFYFILKHRQKSSFHCFAYHDARLDPFDRVTTAI